MTQATVAAAPAGTVRTDSGPTTASAVVDRPRWADAVRAHAARVVVTADIAWWVFGAARLWGGRSPDAVSIGAALTVAALAAARPHRVAPPIALVWASVVSAAALLVAGVSPTGWAGASNAADYVVAAWTIVAVGAWVAQDRRAPDIVVGMVALAATVEMAEAWLPWWGGRSPAAPVLGTFYWYDPFAAFLVPGTVLGFALWVQGRRTWSALGLCAACFGAVGLVFSTSRASLAVALVALLVVAAAQVLEGRTAAGSAVPSRRHRLARTAVAISAMATSVVVICGPPFFSHRVEPFTGTASRAVGQSLSQNGGYRLDFWREALGVFRRHPVTGAGYHSLSAASVGHVPHGWPLSPLAHNGYLQVLSDGGLLLGIPVLVGLAIISVWLLQDVVRAYRGRRLTPTDFALPIVAGAMLVHSAVDFDWSYPADLLLTVTLLAVVVGRRWRRRTVAPDGWTWPALGALTVGVAALVIAAVAAHHGDLRLSLPLGHAAVSR